MIGLQVSVSGILKSKGWVCRVVQTLRLRVLASGFGFRV